MSTVIGKNTPNSEKLRGFVDEVERINATIKEMQESRTAIFAQARADGFHVGGIKYVIKARKMKPHDRQESDTIRDIYMHAAGLDQEPPLFRQIEALAHDAQGNEKLLETLKLMVPPSGEIITKLGEKRVRIWRDKDGEAKVMDYTLPEAGAAHEQKRSTIPPATKKGVPNCTTDEAEALGLEAAKQNKPVIDNPFPYDDARRPRWDLGWRKGTGNDGMGPN